jgi:transposase
VEPLILPAKNIAPGCRHGSGRRSVFTAIVFMLATGCAWRHLPAQAIPMPPWRTPRTN